MKTSAKMLSIGAIAANHGLADSEIKSATSIQGSPNGSRNTPDKGSRSCPNQPNVPVKNATNANRYMTANTMMVVLQTKSSLSRSSQCCAAVFGYAADWSQCAFVAQELDTSCRAITVSNAIPRSTILANADCDLCSRLAKRG